MSKDFSYYLSKFLGDYLIIEKNVSNCTVRSYKETFKLLVEYLTEKEHLKLNTLTFKIVTQEHILNFLNYLENERKCSIQTRNQRLHVIKNFVNIALATKFKILTIYNKYLRLNIKKLLIK